MKKALLAFILLVAAHTATWAQTYNFTNTTGTYADLTSPTILSAANWDDDSYTLTIPFPFSLGGVPFTSVDVESNGFLQFASTSTTNAPWIDVFYADLIEMDATSTVSYLVTGTAPNRIMKIQWKNAGFYDGTLTENANFQVWLHEGSNNIAMHYGPSNITSTVDIFPSGGPDIGIASSASTGNINGVYLQGSGNAPTTIVLTGATSVPSLTSHPTNGRIYNFSATTVGIRESLTNVNVTVFPNPAADQFSINGLTAKGNVTVTVYDVLGKVVLSTQTEAAAAIPVNVAALKQGTYLLEVISSEGRLARQIIKL